MGNCSSVIFYRQWCLLFTSGSENPGEGEIVGKEPAPEWPCASCSPCSHSATEGSQQSVNLLLSSFQILFTMANKISSRSTLRSPDEQNVTSAAATAQICTSNHKAEACGTALIQGLESAACSAKGLALGVGEGQETAQGRDRNVNTKNSHSGHFYCFAPKRSKIMHRFKWGRLGRQAWAG